MTRFTVRALVLVAVLACVLTVILVWRPAHAPGPGGRVLAPHEPAGTEAAPAGRAPASTKPTTPGGAARERSGGGTAVGGPRRDLSQDDARGGHTLARHVGLSDADLRDRLRQEPRIAAASTYTDRATAEQVVGQTLVEAAPRLDAWRRRQGRRPNLALDHRGSPASPVGRSLRRGDRQARPCADAVVVLRWDERRDDYYVLTSYPECRR